MGSQHSHHSKSEQRRGKSKTNNLKHQNSDDKGAQELRSKTKTPTQCKTCPLTGRIVQASIERAPAKYEPRSDQKDKRRDHFFATSGTVLSSEADSKSSYQNLNLTNMLSNQNTPDNCKLRDNSRNQQTSETRPRTQTAISTEKKKKLESAAKSTIYSVESLNEKEGHRCCRACRLLYPQKCWRRIVKEDLLARENFKHCKWWKYLLKEIDKQKEDSNERQWVKQLQFMNQKDKAVDDKSMCFKSVTMIEIEQEIRKGSRYQHSNYNSQIEETAKETGQNIFKAQASFHEQVLLIKKQLQNRKHPIFRLIQEFKKKFYKKNLDLLQKSNMEDSLRVFNENNSTNSTSLHSSSKSSSSFNGGSHFAELKQLFSQIHYFIDIVVKATTQMYQIPLRQSDVKRDLLVNLCTNFILSDEVYFLIFNLISMNENLQLTKINNVMMDKNILKNQLDFPQLKLKPQFTFDESFRETYKHEESDNSKRLSENEITTPYQETIANLQKVMLQEQPMCKLEQIFVSCTQSIINDIKAFWNDYEISDNELFIDSDSLQAILIYVVSRLNYPQIWTEISLIEEFIPEAVLMSNRAYYMIMIKASCEYLINLEPMKQTIIEEQNSDLEFPSEAYDNQTPDYHDEFFIEKNFSVKIPLRQLSPPRLRKTSALLNFNEYQLLRIRTKKIGDNQDQGGNHDRFFFEENCILQDDLQFQNSNKKRLQHLSTMIEVSKDKK